MDIEKLNRKHFIETDMYYRVEYGLSSKLVKYENCIIFLEVTLGRRWRKNYNATAIELATLWKETHEELSGAIACKVFIYDNKNNPYKSELIMAGVRPDYDAKKGIIFKKQHLN